MNRVIMRLRDLLSPKSRESKRIPIRRRPPLTFERLESRDLLAVLLPAPSATLNAQAQIALTQHPADNPTLPAGMDIFNPPVANLVPAPGTPQFATLTNQANPDNSLAATGANFTTLAGASAGQDTVFQAYGQTTSSNGDLTTSSLQELNGNRAVVTLDAGLPQNSMYLVWPENGAGAGLPFAVNKTAAWWIGPNPAIAGQTVSIFGENLSNGATTPQSWIYLQPTQGQGQWIAPTSVNPYKVDFVVPTTLATGSYQIWIHNGHGGQYGWSSPMTLTVQSATNYSHTIVKLSNFAGGLPNTGVDATPALRAAIQAIGNNGPGTIQLQAGTYYLSGNPLAITAGGNLGIYLQGAGKNVTFIKALTGYSANNFLILGPSSAVSDVTLDTTGGALTGAAVSGGVSLSNISVIAHGYADYGGSDIAHLTITNCDFVGEGIFITSSTQIFISGCNFYATDQTAVVLNCWSGNDISVTNCTCQDFNVNSSNPVDHGSGRFFSGSAIWGTQADIYLGDNTTIHFAQPSTYGDQNMGEQFMWEGGAGTQTAMVTSATSTTATLTSLGQDFAGQEAVIVGGKGEGQHRTILSTNFANGGTTLTLSSPWDVPPDGTSRINIVTTVERVAIYHNTLQGNSNFQSASASTGIEPFVGGFDFFIDSNKLSLFRWGITTFSYSDNFIHCTLPLFDNIIQNNIITNCVYGVRNVDSGPVAGEFATDLGTVVRNNTMSSIQAAAWYIDAMTGESMDLTVFEHNNVTGAPIGIYVWRPSSGPIYLVIYKNVFDRGSAPLAGSQTIAAQAGDVPIVRNTQFLNYLNPQGPSGTITSVLPMLSWNAIPGATHYDVWLTDMTTNQSPVQRNTNIQTNSWTLTTTLTAGHSYTWWVEALDGSGLVSPWSMGLSFFVAPLTVPSPTTPIGSPVFVNAASLTPTFTWSAVNGADSYDVWVNDVTTNQVQVVRQTTASASLTSPISLTLGDQYQWWVRALNNSGNSSYWSSGAGFNVSLASPTPTGPIGTLANASPTFSWAPVAGATLFDVWVNDTTTGQSQVLRTPLTGSQIVTTRSWIAPTPLRPGDTFTWWIRAIGSNGAASPWSNGASFTVAMLATPNILGPVGPTPSTALTLQWLSLDANWYEVWVNDATSGASQVIHSLHVFGTHFPTTNLTAGHTYQWWVRGFSNDGDVSAWSLTGTFSTI